MDLPSTLYRIFLYDFDQDNSALRIYEEKGVPRPLDLLIASNHGDSLRVALLPLSNGNAAEHAPVGSNQKDLPAELLSFTFPKSNLTRLSSNFLLVLLKKSPTWNQWNPSSNVTTHADNNVAYGFKFVNEEMAVSFLNACSNEDKNARKAGGEALERHHLHGMESCTVRTYFQYYSKMANQMNMLQDSIRTSFYQKAILENRSDFRHKIAMDIGAGSGILSFFAAQAGAEKVYAIEASSMANIANVLLAGNPHLSSRIHIVAKTVEDSDTTDIPEKVDVLVSEPIGTFLFNERMIETYLYARDKYLKPGGKMFPNKCVLGVAPFCDHSLYNDMMSRSLFWTQTDFYGVNLSTASGHAIDEQFKQPVVDYVDPNILLAPPHYETYDFQTIDRHALKHIQFQFKFPIAQPCLVHGVAGWFDAAFEGSDKIISFSTSPWSAPTHWYQIRFLLKKPLAVNVGQVLAGSLTMEANTQQSYFIHLRMYIVGTNFASESLEIDLKDDLDALLSFRFGDPDYRYYTSPASYVPPQPSVSSTCFSSTFPSAIPTTPSSSQFVVPTPSNVTPPTFTPFEERSL
ncbi:histone arginine methyltransferase PRMT4/CARM1 [Cardiosporidium cionae]|uniref:type I protein arginine methyltransferase n=1 Tax=Cardiosporidium cionae TaxID=476202 RepID=A0ABQ7J564_9APIC|nr:histone arginine methyltransferase PRMT4/CARM1 [Cardiosporidium cionae]|eukprot:KAF8819133.1 histone arginine methyltransferase PRMT4/CARM1 [Cardiosporidium cionae]